MSTTLRLVTTDSNGQISTITTAALQTLGVAGSNTDSGGVSSKELLGILLGIGVPTIVILLAILIYMCLRKPPTIVPPVPYPLPVSDPPYAPPKPYSPSRNTRPPSYRSGVAGPTRLLLAPWWFYLVRETASNSFSFWGRQCSPAEWGSGG